MSFVLPLIWVLILSFLGTGQTGPTGEVIYQFIFANYARFLTDSYYLNDLLLRTIRLAAIATIFSVVTGYVGAFVIVRGDERLQTWMVLLVMLPLWVNLVVRTLSLMVVLGRNGPVNQLLVGLGIADRPLQLLRRF